MSRQAEFDGGGSWPELPYFSVNSMVVLEYNSDRAADNTYDADFIRQTADRPWAWWRSDVEVKMF